MKIKQFINNINDVKSLLTYFVIFILLTNANLSLNIVSKDINSRKLRVNTYNNKFINLVKNNVNNAVENIKNNNYNSSNNISNINFNKINTQKFENTCIINENKLIDIIRKLYPYFLDAKPENIESNEIIRNCMNNINLSLLNKNSVDSSEISKAMKYINETICKSNVETSNKLPSDLLLNMHKIISVQRVSSSILSNKDKEICGNYLPSYIKDKTPDIPEDLINDIKNYLKKFNKTMPQEAINYIAISNRDNPHLRNNSSFTTINNASRISNK